MSVPNETEVTNAETAKPVTESLDQRMDKFVEAALAKDAATESATASTEEAAPVEEAAKAESTETPAEPAVVAKAEEAKDEFTVEQLGDPKFYDRLNREGWTKLEQAHPAVYARIKAAYSAAGKLPHYLASQPKEERAVPETKTLDPKILELTRKLNSLDETEAAEAAEQLADYALEKKMAQMPEFARMRSEQLEARSFAIAVSKMPDIAKVDRKLIDDEFDASPELQELIEEFGPKPSVIASVMQLCARNVIAKQKAEAVDTAAKKAAADEKKAQEQKQLRSNANVGSSVVAQSSTGATPKAKLPFDQRLTQFVSDEWDKAATNGG